MKEFVKRVVAVIVFSAFLGFLLATTSIFFEKMFFLQN